MVRMNFWDGTNAETSRRWYLTSGLARMKSRNCCEYCKQTSSLRLDCQEHTGDNNDDSPFTTSPYDNTPHNDQWPMTPLSPHHLMTTHLTTMNDNDSHFQQQQQLPFHHITLRQHTVMIKYMYIYSHISYKERKELTKEEGIYSSKIDECMVAHISYVGVRLWYLIYD